VPGIFDARRLTKVRLHHRSRLASLRCPMRYVMYQLTVDGNRGCGPCRTLGRIMPLPRAAR
jgi:hypothetical protein